MTPDAAAQAAAAIFTAAKKSGRAWMGRRLVWCAWHEGAVVIVTGGPEQAVPIADDLTLADSTGAAALRLTVSAQTLEPGTPGWDGAARLLAERRLNGAAQPAELLAQWATESTITRLSITDGALQ